ncbi:GntR family transcriptional regulator [Roseibium aggregatum]|uniref:GntR family transcriptional regulator n=1 Tax=Roseibium aggregatum TaxID=187304 RepID=UPI0025AD391D|nr:GntR family transcriptional regulator [Roseibium aggregatum]WJS05609.1 GntR family transcriptional regulator [Roseibium aggregatum]
MSAFSKAGDQEQSLYDAVLDEISTGKLAAGQRLKVSELAKRYGVSTSPVREVLRLLQGEGFVEIHPNKGAIVKHANASTIQNIFEVLQLLEPYFVTWFADYAQADMIDEMEEIQRKIEELPTGNLTEFRKLDYQFHWSICRRHYNHVAADLWKKLRTALNVHGAKLKISPVRHQAIMDEHRELLAAFRANDAARAEAVINKHVAGSFTQMSQQMRALGL